MQTASFHSKFCKRFNQFKIEEVNRFGVRSINYVDTKDERDIARKKFNEKKKEVSDVDLTGRIIGHQKHIPHNKRPIYEISPSDYFYENEVKKDWYYELENFSLKLFNAGGEQIYLIQEKDNNDYSFLEEKIVGAFYLINKKQKDKLDFGESVEFWKTYRYARGCYLLVILPKIKFRDNRAGYDIPFLFGRKINYLEAKQIWNKMDSFGFSYFKIFIDEIEHTKHYKCLMAGERINRQQLKHFKQAKRSFEAVLKLKAEKLASVYTETFGLCRIKVPKHYRIQNKLNKLNDNIDKGRY